MKHLMKKSLCIITFAFVFACIFSKPMQIHAASYKAVAIPDDGKQVKANGLRFYTKDIWVENKKDSSESGYAHELHVVKNGKDLTAYRTSAQAYFSKNIVTNGSRVYFLMNDENRDYAKIYEYKFGGKAKSIKTFKKSLASVEGYYNGRMYLQVEDPKDELKFRLVTFSLKDKRTKYITKAAEINVCASNNQYYWIRYTKTGKVVLFNARNNKMKTIIDRGMERVYVKGNKCYYIVVHKESMKNVGWDEDDFGIWEDYMDGPVKIDIYRMNINGTGKKLLVKNIKVREVKEFTNKSIKYKDDHKKVKTKKF